MEHTMKKHLRHVSASQRVEEREALRSKLFSETWKDLIPKVFEDVPTYYDKGNAVASLGLCSWWSNRFVAAMDIPKGATVLDVCSGTHDVPLRLLRRDPSLKIYAVDRSSEMLAEGGRRAKELGFSITSQVSDAHTLPFKDATFDTVTLQFATRHLKVTDVFREIFRVLKPGGVFYHDDMLRPASKIIEGPYLLYLRASVYLTAALFGSSPESRKCVGYFADAIHNFYTQGEMDELLKEIGFTDIKHKSFLTGALSFHIARKAQ